MELYGKFEDESLIKEVLASFPVRVENTLTTTEQNPLGRSQKTDEGPRDSYDPAPRLSTEDGGDKVITLDYNDLPTDWKDYNFSDLFSQEEASILITTEHVFIMLSISGT